MESGKWKGKKRVPELRFPGFEGEWKEKKLGEVFNSISSGKSKLGKGIGNYNLYGSTGIIGKINKCDYEGKKILIARVGENTGYVNLANGEYGVTDNTLILDEYDEKSEVVNYYYYYLCNYDFRRIKIGSGQPLITGRDLKNIKVYRSKIEEQQKIGDFFYKIDKKLELQQQRIEALKEYKKGMMQKIFSQEIRFKDDNGKDYPEWEEKRFKDTLYKIIDNRGKTPPVQEKGIPLLEVNSLGNLSPNYSEVKKYVSKEIYNSWFRGHIEYGDLLFTTVGKTGLVSIQSDNNAVIAQNIVGFRFKNNNSIFMYYLLSNFNNWKKIKRIEMGAVQPSVKVTQMVLLKFRIPVIQEQTKIANFLSSLDKKIELEEEKLENFKQFKKGLMQKMFI